MNPTPPTPALYGVLGNPIAHSRSPAIHADFAQQCGINMHYQRVLVPTEPQEAFAQQVQSLQAQGWLGVNVTVPFKHQAYAVASSHSPAAHCAQAANTLVLGPKGIHVDNTDGAGLCSDLARLLALQGLDLAQCHVLLLGAGGAAAGCLQALHQAGVRSLVVLNRTLERAQALAVRAQNLGLPAAAGLLAQAPHEVLQGNTQSHCKANTDAMPWVVVNATAASLAGHSIVLHPGWYASAVLAYDMMYAAQPTPWLAAVHSAYPGLAHSDGLGMLVFQAAHAFTLWTGQKPNASATLVRMRTTL